MNKLFAFLLLASSAALAAEPAADWQRIKDPTTGVEFDFPCATEAEQVQDAPKVMGYACDQGELFYIVMLVELPSPDAKVRLAWLEQFSIAQFETLRKRASEVGAQFDIKSNESIEYQGSPAKQVQWELSGKKGVVRVVAGKKIGVSLQLASKRPPTDEPAKRFFDSLVLQ